MSALFIIILICFVMFNIRNDIKLSKAKTRVDELMYTSYTSFLFLITLITYKTLEFIFGIQEPSIKYVDILVLMFVCIMFVIINGFVLISKAMQIESKSRCLFGFLIIIFFPVHMILSIPILIIIWIFKIKDYNDHVIKVYDEEFFDIEVNDDNS